MLNGKWNTVEEMVLVLKIPYDATISLQNPRLILSDVFGIWQRMEIRLKACAIRPAYKTRLAKDLLQTMKEKGRCLFDNPEMESCIFLDPRFRNEVLKNPVKVENATSYLKKMWKRIKSFQEAIPSENEETDESTGLNFSIDEDAELNKLMSECAINDVASAISNDSDEDFESALANFKPDRLPCEKSALKFWLETQKESILFQVAMAVFSIPPTQVKIEQDFSRLGYLFNSRRYRLGQDLLESMLSIHLNKDLFEEVKIEKLNSTNN